MLGNGVLLPHSSTKNNNGMHWSNFNLPVEWIWGEFDVMMCLEQVDEIQAVGRIIKFFRLTHGMGDKDKLKMTYNILPRAGHFAVSDQPKKAATALLHWMMNILPPNKFNQVFTGLEGISRRDEEEKSRRLNNLVNNM